jgi:uncharacterized protein (TIGR03435 family)
MTDHAFPKSNFSGASLVIAVGLMSLLAPSCLGQAGAPPTPTSPLSADTPYISTMTFDVASVRENKDVERGAGFTMSGRFVPHTTQLRLENWDIENLISYAYAVDRYQIVGAPKWQSPTLFVIEAKGDPEADTKIAGLNKEQELAEQEHMLQALLEERFQLKTHWETKDGDVYNLVLVKGKSKLGAEGLIPPSTDELKRFGDRPIPTLYQKNDGQGYDFIAHGCSMVDLGRMLKAQFGRPVIDKTGLTGKYDFVLKYKGRWDQDRPADDLDPMPPMDRALQEQLGLKVEAAKGPVKMLIIDHIDKPSQN